MNVRHILGISCGKDRAALTILSEITPVTILFMTFWDRKIKKMMDSHIICVPLQAKLQHRVLLCTLLKSKIVNVKANRIYNR